MPEFLNDLKSWDFSIEVGGHTHRLHGYHRHSHSGRDKYHFLHGNGFCALTLAGVAAYLDQSAECWLTDVPGHGGSEQPKHRMPDWQLMAEAVATGLKQNHPTAEPVVGIGHSMGGVLTLLAAARNPHLFSRIILLDPVLFSPEIVLAQQIFRKTGMWKRSALVQSVSRRRQRWPDRETMLAELRCKSLYKHWQPDVLEAFIDGGSYDDNGERQLSCDPHWEGAIFGSYPRGLWRAVRHVNVPVDILVAEDSYNFILRSAKKASAVNTNIRWQRFGNTHCFPMEQPKETADKIKQLLA